MVYRVKVWVRLGLGFGRVKVSGLRVEVSGLGEA